MSGQTKIGMNKDNYWPLIRDAWNRVRDSGAYPELWTEMMLAAKLSPTMQVYCAIAVIYEQIRDIGQELYWYQKALATGETLQDWQYRRIEQLQELAVKVIVFRQQEGDDGE